MVTPSPSPGVTRRQLVCTNFESISVTLVVATGTLAVRPEAPVVLRPWSILVGHLDFYPDKQELPSRCLIPKV